jgi:phosphatidylinositol alpha-1,6-mannosyltransferase
MLLFCRFKEKPKLTIASQVLFSGLASYFIKLIFNIPYIIVAHGEEFSIFCNAKSKIKFHIAKVISLNANLIICNTDNTSKIIEKYYDIDQSKMTVINPIVDINEANIDLASALEIKQTKFPNKKILLMTGRLYEERKGFDTAIEAFAKVKKIYPEVSLVIIGPGSNAKIFNLVEKNNLCDDVHFLGQVERNILLQFYAICDIFLMPNRTLKNGDMEGFGIVFLEANMFSKPVIGGRSGGVSDAIEDMVSGILVDGEKVEEVSESILKLLLNEKLRKSLGDSARQRVLAKFNEEIQSIKFQNVLNQVLS